MAAREGRDRGFDLEETLGTNWLNKIGVVILVFGIAFFLAYQLREMGPAGKVLVGWVVSGVLLGGGIFLERKPGYAMLGRAGIGGGWALGRFMRQARQRPWFDRTLFVVLGDHGPHVFGPAEIPMPGYLWRSLNVAVSARTFPFSSRKKSANNRVFSSFRESPPIRAQVRAKR